MAYFGSWALDFLVLAVGLLGVVYYYFTSTFDYWKKRGVPFIEPSPFFGNFRRAALQQEYRGSIVQEFYKWGKEQGHKYVGVFHSRRPTLIITDVDVVKTIMVKDFSFFTDRGMPVPDREREPLAAHLFHLEGREWKGLRSKLSPTFTSGKMKQMFSLVKDCAIELRNYLEPLAEKGETIELKDILARYSTDVIGTCAFGIQCNSLKYPDAEFRRMGQKIFQANWADAFFFFMFEAAPILRKIITRPMLRREVSEFFINSVNETVALREKSNIVRNDFLNLLIQLKNKGKVEDDHHHEHHDHHNEANNGHSVHSAGIEGFDEKMIPAQSFIFFVAGFETSSSALSMCLYELAMQPDLQDKVREEVDRVLDQHGADVGYDALQEMTYMDQVLQEAMRMYPALGLIPRVCTKDYPLPESGAKLEKGTRVLIPAYAIHRDPEFYPDPDRFDPDRFTEEAKQSRPHYTYLPFGEGPRICIGLRFAYMQMKVALTAIVRSYELSVCEKTVIPIKLDPRTFVTSSECGIYLKITKRQKKAA